MGLYQGAPHITVSNTVESTSEVGEGVLVHCIKEGGKIRVRILSEGYNAGWNVQFPKNLRMEGARFVVASVKESGRGGFYRASGSIRRLED